MEKSPRSARRPSSNTTNHIHKSKTNTELQRLEQQFTDFHKNHPPQTKIPDHLRQAVLTAIQNGTREQKIRKACVLTSTQIRQWEKSNAAAIKSQKAQQPRILELCDDNPIQNVNPVEITPAQPNAMEIRLSGWSISINHTGQ